MQGWTNNVVPFIQIKQELTTTQNMNTIVRREIDIIPRKVPLLCRACWSFNSSWIYKNLSGSLLRLVVFQHTTISITWIRALIDETEFWQQNIWTLHRLHKKKLKKITTCSLNEMIWFKILFVKPKGSRGYWSDWLSALGLHWQASGCPLVMVTG